MGLKPCHRWLVLATMLIGMDAPQAFADARERHEPVALEIPTGQAVITIEPVAAGDDTPIGPNLQALVVTGATIENSSANLSGQPFIGQPISPRLINQVLSEITRRYSLMGHPVMAQWGPDKTLSAGVLTVRVTDVVIGGVTVKGAKPDIESYMKKRLTPQSGQAIDSRKFAVDMDSFNRYPFRQVSATFRPNAEGKASDLELTVTETKPWEAYFGYRTTSSQDFTWRRYVAGLTLGGMLGRDSVISLQAIASSDFILHHDMHPKYKDMVITYVIPVSRRLIFEASVDDGELNFRYDGKHYRFIDVMTAWGLRQDLSDFYPPGTSADIRYGLEAKNEQGNVITGGVLQSRLSAEVYQVYLGFHITRDATSHYSDFDIIARASPGGLGSGNSDRQFELQSEGRLKSARYNYVSLTYERMQTLGLKWIWHSQINGQWASDPIPYSEQPGVGGPGLVRGYYLFDGSFDSALVIRNELGLRDKPGVQALPSPYLIFDMGAGRDLVLKRTSTVASSGLGARLKLTKQASLRLEALHTLRKGDVTKRGAQALGAYLMVKY